MMPEMEPTKLPAPTMLLGGALGQLFVDLDGIPERERSAYETALHKELLELANRSRPLTSPITLTGHELRAAIDDFPGLEVRIDVQPTDTTRVRCDDPHCPNKRM